MASTMSSYIPTSGATVTRAAETLLAPNAVIGDYQTKGSVLFIGNAVDPSIDSNASFLALSGSGWDFLLYSNDPNEIRAAVGAASLNASTTGLSAGNFKAAGWYDLSLPESAISLNGAAVVSDAVGSTGTLGAGFDMQFMLDTVNQYNTIKQVSFWPGVVIGDTGIAEASARTYTNEFAMIVSTTTASETFTIPCQNVGTFNAVIDWGDNSDHSTITAYNDADLVHTYNSPGDHVIRITGTFPNIYFNNVGDKLKVKSVENLGTVGWISLNRAFNGCTNMASFTAGTTDTSAVLSMPLMFNGCTSLTTLDVSGFNTAAVTDMSYMFYNCTSLTSLDVSSFNTAAVTSMNNMFRGCSSLTTLDTSGFSTTLVTNMGNMFRDCTSLTTLDVSNFNTAAVTDMNNMFRNCTSLTDIVGVDTFDIGGLNSTTDLTNFATGVTLPTARYDALLLAWEAQDPFDGMAPNFGSSKYTGGGAVATARASLISRDGWTITDGGIA